MSWKCVPLLHSDFFFNIDTLTSHTFFQKAHARQVFVCWVNTMASSPHVSHQLQFRWPCTTWWPCPPHLRPPYTTWSHCVPQKLFFWLDQNWFLGSYHLGWWYTHEPWSTLQAKWLYPKNKKSLQMFLGFNKFYQCFIQSFLDLTFFWNFYMRTSAWIRSIEHQPKCEHHKSAKWKGAEDLV
jgi:hypothetical protein